jgi:hypothetical protein
LNFNNKVVVVVVVVVMEVVITRKRDLVEWEILHQAAQTPHRVQQVPEVKHCFLYSQII